MPKISDPLKQPAAAEPRIDSIIGDKIAEDAKPRQARVKKAAPAKKQADRKKTNTKKKDVPAATKSRVARPGENTSRQRSAVAGQSEKPPKTRGLKDGWQRETLILSSELVEKASDLAFWSRRKLREVVNAALEQYLRGKTVKKAPSQGSL